MITSPAPTVRWRFWRWCFVRNADGPTGAHLTASSLTRRAGKIDLTCMKGGGGKNGGVCDTLSRCRKYVNISISSMHSCSDWLRVLLGEVCRTAPSFIPVSRISVLWLRCLQPVSKLVCCSLAICLHADTLIHTGGADLVGVLFFITFPPLSNICACVIVVFFFCNFVGCNN